MYTERIMSYEIIVRDSYSVTCMGEEYFFKCEPYTIYRFVVERYHEGLLRLAYRARALKKEHLAMRLYYLAKFYTIIETSTLNQAFLYEFGVTAQEFRERTNTNKLNQPIAVL